jgi:hypothetical protein
MGISTYRISWLGPKGAGPHRLVAEDTTLSRWRHGFESRWGCSQKFDADQGDRALFGLSCFAVVRVLSARSPRDAHDSRLVRESSQSLCEHAVAICRAVLIPDRGDVTAMTGASHQLCRAGASGWRPRQPGVAQIMEAKVCSPWRLPRLGPNTVDRAWRDRLATFARKEPCVRVPCGGSSYTVESLTTSHDRPELSGIPRLCSG